MGDPVLRRRRYPEDVVGRAALVGMASSIPVALLVLLLPVFLQALAGGANLVQALAACALTDDEDLEMLPLFLGGAAMFGALTALVAAGTWCVVSARVPDRPWVARAAASAAAVGVPMLGVAVQASWTAAVPAAFAAGLVAFVAVPWAGYVRPARDLAPVS